MREVMIRGIDFGSMEEIHEFLQDELDFPAYYGRNLDALYDVMTELNEDIDITLDLTGMEDDELRDRMLRLAEVLEDAALSNTGLSVTVEEEV